MALKNNNIRILSQYFYPDVASTGQLLTELAVRLVTMGLKVDVLTANPTYDAHISAASTEIYQGIKISRLKLPKLNKNHKFSKIFVAVVFFLKILFKVVFSNNKHPLLIVSNPPFLPLVGYINYKVRNVKYIYLVHDIHPENAEAVGFLKKNSLISKLWKRLRNKIYLNSYKVIALSDSMKQKLVSISHLKSEQIKIIHNWADEDLFKGSPRFNPLAKKLGINNKFVVLYSGNLGLSYNIEMLLAAAEILKKNEEIIFIIAGNGVKRGKLISIKENKNLVNVRFLPYQPKEELTYLLYLANVSVVTYEKIIEWLSMPSKLYTSLAVGKPIIGICRQESEVGKIIEENKCGYCVERDPNQLAKIINLISKDKLLQNKLGENSRNLYEKEYTLKHSANMYFNLIVGMPV